MPFDPSPRRDERPNDTCPACGKPIARLVGPLVGLQAHLVGPNGETDPNPTGFAVFRADHLDGSSCLVVGTDPGGRGS